MNDMLTLFVSLIFTLGSIVLLRMGAISPLVSLALMGVGVGLLIYYLAPWRKRR